MQRIYLDYNATTPVIKEAEDAYTKALKSFGNPSSVHQDGQSAKVSLENARDSIAHHLDCHPERLIFTSSGTESNATILYGVSLKKLCNQEPVHIITSTSEHACILKTCQHLESLGAEITYVDCNENGQINPVDIEKMIRPSTCLISIMLANNETGVIQDIKKITQLANEHGIDCHSDTTQAIGKLPVSINELGLDYATVSSHKCYAPKGVGGLIVKEKDTMPALIQGGGQERLLRSGTENVPGILALEASLNYIFTHFESIQKHLKDLDHYLQNELQQKVPNHQINGTLKPKLPNTLNLSLPGYNGEAIMMACDMNGISIATGSACSTGSIDPSHVLLAMGKQVEESLEACRISWGIQTKRSDIDLLIKEFQNIVRL